jgi:hypothetical protein
MFIYFLALLVLHAPLCTSTVSYCLAAFCYCFNLGLCSGARTIDASILILHSPYIYVSLSHDSRDYQQLISQRSSSYGGTMPRYIVTIIGSSVSNASGNSTGAVDD